MQNFVLFSLLQKKVYFTDLVGKVTRKIQGLLLASKKAQNKASITCVQLW
jgi:hypothetical protein